MSCDENSSVRLNDHGLRRVKIRKQAHDFVDNMADAASLTYSAPIMTWYWTVTHNLDSLADAYNMDGISRAVNGSAATTATLKARCASFKQVLAYYGQSLPAGAACSS